MRNYTVTVTVDLKAESAQAAREAVLEALMRVCIADVIDSCGTPFLNYRVSVAREIKD